MKPLELLKDVLFTARVYLRITCVIWTCACIGWYAYCCYTGKGLALAVPVTLIATIDHVSVTTDALPVSISQADPKTMAKIEKAGK